MAAGMMPLEASLDSSSSSLNHHLNRRSLRVQPQGALLPIYNCKVGGNPSVPHPANCQPKVDGYFGLINDTKTGETVRHG